VRVLHRLFPRLARSNGGISAEVDLTRPIRNILVIAFGLFLLEIMFLIDFDNCLVT